MKLFPHGEFFFRTVKSFKIIQTFKKTTPEHSPRQKARRILIIAAMLAISRELLKIPIPYMERFHIWNSSIYGTIGRLFLTVIKILLASYFQISEQILHLGF